MQDPRRISGALYHDLSRGDRREFEARMEGQRQGAQHEAAIKGLRPGCCLARDSFRNELLERIQGRLGDQHAEEFRQAEIERQGRKMLGQELKRLGWKAGEQGRGRKTDLDNPTIAARLRRETTLTVKKIAETVCLGTSKSATMKLAAWMQAHPGGSDGRRKEHDK